MTSISKSAANRTARALQQVYGAGSAAEASDRAEERVANIDIGGFAHWEGRRTTDPLRSGQLLKPTGIATPGG